MRISFAPLAAPALVATLAAFAGGCSSGDGSNDADTGDVNATTNADAYKGTAAVSYAHAHYADGNGLCSTFVSHCLEAGGLSIANYPWVPDLVAHLSGFFWDEHSASGAATANAGDVIVFSDQSGSKFCYDTKSDALNCGHTCIVVTAGTSASTIKVACHNNAHDNMPVSYLLTGGYKYYRVYHIVTLVGPSKVKIADDEIEPTETTTE